MSRLSVGGDDSPAVVQRADDEAELKKLMAVDYSTKTKEEKNSAFIRVQELKGSLFKIA